jgi:hypothetical protein
VIERAGIWRQEFGDQSGMTAPLSQFKHYYIYAVSHPDSAFTQPGAIVVGHTWEDDGMHTWKIMHGTASALDATVFSSSGLTYLGPEWCPEYVKLSEEVFKKLGGKLLMRFITHP